MIIMLALLVGIILSLALVCLARTKGSKGERVIYATGLVAAAVLYFVFGLAGGASAQWLLVESLGVVIYSTMAWVSLRGRLSILALGWATHVLWDLLLHLNGAGAEYTPLWYPWLCVSFDLVIASAVVALMRRGVADIRNTT